MALCGVIAASLFSTAEASAASADIQKANIFHAFNWSFAQVQEELPNIAAAGYGAVQMSPVQGNCKAGAGWWYAYQPYDFDFPESVKYRNGQGTRAALKTLCEEANKYGVKIIIDVVGNHVNGSASESTLDPFWLNASKNGHNSTYTRKLGAINYKLRSQIVKNQLSTEYPDVVSENPEVIARARKFIELLYSLGVSGIRWDAAKHITLPSDLNNQGGEWWPQVTSVGDMWHYGEILDNPYATGNNTNWNCLQEYTTYMSVTDDVLGSNVMGNFRDGKIPSMVSNHAASHGIASDKLVYWAESHDTFSNTSEYGGWTKNISQDAVDRAYMFLACRDKETALYFSRPNDINGNPVTDFNDIKMARKGSTHGLTDPAIKAVNNFRKDMAGRPDNVVVVSGSNDKAYACITRQGGGAVIILPKAVSREVTVTNGGTYVPDGEYVDEISGNTFTVARTTIKGTVGSTGVAVIRVKDAGVADITANGEEIAPVYYNLQGQKVDNPQGGIFIKKAGGKAEKVAL